MTTKRGISDVIERCAVWTGPWLYWQAVLGADPGPLTPAEATLFERLRNHFAANPGTDHWPIDDG